jgi:hypothetical protein
VTFSSILPAWQSGDTSSVSSLLAEKVIFSSPVADYRGRRDAAHMLELIGRVLEDIKRIEVWGGDRQRVCAFTARHAGDWLQGMLREEHDETGRLVHVTLFLRPYRTLGAAIGRMRELLVDFPLPSRAA